MNYVEACEFFHKHSIKKQTLESFTERKPTLEELDDICHKLLNRGLGFRYINEAYDAVTKHWNLQPEAVVPVTNNIETVEDLIKQLIVRNEFGVWFFNKDGQYIVIPSYLKPACDKLITNPIVIHKLGGLNASVEI